MSKDSKLAPLKDKAVLTMVGTQFLSALGDSGFRNLVALMITVPGLAEEKTVVPLALAQIFFMLPYVFLAPFVGNLSDRFPKKYVLAFASGFRALFLGVVFFIIMPSHQSYLILYLAVAYLGTLAAVYSPAKYGLIPELTPSKNLVVVNGIVESGTLAAILLGTLGLGALADLAGLWNRGGSPAVIDQRGALICLASLIGVFLLSACLAFFLPKKPAYAVENPEKALGFSDYVAGVKMVFSHGPLRRAIFGVAIFWTIAAGLNVLFFPFGSKYLGLESNTAKTSLYFTLTIGIIIGGVTVGFLPGAERLVYVRKSAWAFALSIFGFSFCRTPLWGYGMLILTGIASGVYLIPLNAAIQRHSKREMTARVVATSNLINNVTMILLSGILLLLSKLALAHILVWLLGLVGLSMGVLGGLIKPETTDE